MTRYGRALAAIWLLSWLGLAYSLAQGWPPSVAPYYLALADDLKTEVHKFDKQTGGTHAASKAAGGIVQAQRWKANRNELRALLWRQWALQLALFVLAAAGGLLLLAGMSYWEILCGASALWYLSGDYFSPIYGIFLRGASTFSEVLARGDVLARHPAMFASIVVYDVLIPLLCVFMLVCAAASLGRRQRNLG